MTSSTTSLAEVIDKRCLDGSLGRASGAERDHSQRRQRGNDLCLFGGAHSVVHAFEKERQSDRLWLGLAPTRKQDCAARWAPTARSGTRATSTTADVIRSQTGGDSGFFQLLQQTLVECPVSFDVALQQAVFDRAFIELVGFLLLLVHGGVQHAFALQTQPGTRCEPGRSLSCSST